MIIMRRRRKKRKKRKKEKGGGEGLLIHMQCFLCTRHHYNCFPYISSFNPENKPMIIGAVFNLH